MKTLILTGLITFASLTGCAFPGVFKLDIQQGNIVTVDMLEQLEVGMTPRQVKFIMGLPVVRQPFSNNQWDYLYYIEQDDEVSTQYRITIFFDKEGRYSHYDGELPATAS